MEFTCSNATTYPPYDTTDVFKGICRLIFDTNNECEVLCTLWPGDSHMDEGTMVIDDTVRICGTVSYGWTDCKCKIVNMQPHHLCSSVHLKQPTTLETVDSMGAELASLLGLPVSAGCTIMVDGKRPVEISRMSGGHMPMGVVATSTILLRSIPTHTKERSGAVAAVEEVGETSGHKSLQSQETFSNIRVVQDLIERVVFPAAYLPTYVQYKGIMLLGPPGVGKTFAVRAVQHLCKDWCKIHLLELGIPALLADPDPLGRLEMLLGTIARLKKQRIVSSQFNESELVSPSSPVPARSGDRSAFNTPVSSRAPIRYTPGARTPQSTPTPSASSAGKFVHQTPGSRISGGSSFAAMLAANSSNKKKPGTASGTPGGPAATSSSSVSCCELTESALYFPQLVFVVLDELDALGRGDGVQGELQTVIKNRLCQWLDALNARKTDASFAAAAVRCCVLATSNRVEDIDMSFRRGGRLEHEIVVLTSPADRRTLLQSLLTRSFLGAVVPGDDQQVFTQEVLTDAAAVIAERSGGYVAADLVALVRDMLSRFSQPSSSAHSQRSDRRASSHGAAADHLSLLFEQAARVVPPSCLRGVSIQLPSLNYSDVIGYEEVKRSLRRVLAFSSPDMMAKIRRFGLGAPGGVLLHGPPGNSKTRLVMAAAAHHGLPVISLSSADIFSPYVGDAEAEIRKAFRTARQARPCVLFIDELDSIVTNRESGGGSSSGVEGRVLATLLTEMDGIQGDDDRGGGQSNSGGVIVLGATNRLDFIDAALIRKGRFHHVLFVPLPNANERQLILQYFAEKCALDEKTIAELKSTVAKREGLSGAEIENLCREAVLLRFKNSYNV